MSAEKPTAAVADDDALYRAGVVSVLERSGYDVVGQAADPQELLRIVADTGPQVAVVDIRMPPTHTTEGLQAALTIRQRWPSTAVLVLSAHLDTEFALQLVSGAGGLGYLLKSRVAAVEDFCEALARLARGSTVLDPAVVAELVNTRRRVDPLAELTQREREVLALIAEGRSNAGIGRALWITESTVEKHVRRVMTKLDLPDGEDDHRRVLAAIAFLSDAVRP